MQVLKLTLRDGRKRTTIIFFISDISRIGGNEKGSVVVMKAGKPFEVVEGITEIFGMLK